MNEPIDLNTVIVRREDLMTSELSETEVVMLNVERGYYYGMQETAKMIWSHLSSPRSVSEIAAHLMTQFAVDQETCEREVLAFVKELLKDGLVNVVDTASGKTS